MNARADSGREVLCVHPSAFIHHRCFLRDGVTGNTSGFEPEDEGSIPSPAASLSSSTQKVLRFVCNGNHFPFVGGRQK